MAKKILLLGANGMLGHTVLAHLSKFKGIELYYTTRNTNLSSQHHISIDLRNFDKLEKIINSLNPDYVINCAGVLVSDSEKNLKNAIEVNALLPHKIISFLNKDQFFIHISTDCVFDGEQGWYDVNTTPNPKDYYGMTKALGEINNTRNCVTLRTSIIGFEISDHKTGLLEWFINSEDKVNGFTKALWNGVTTLDLAIVISEIITSNKRYSGLIHISSNSKISKYELLNIINKKLNLRKTIIPKSTPIIDKTLSPSKNYLNGLFPNEYEKMIDRYLSVSSNFQN